MSTANLQQRLQDLQREGAQELFARATDMAKVMTGGQLPEQPLARGGRKAHQLDGEPTG